MADEPANTPQRPDDVVASVDFLKVTEQAALASARWLGRGDNHAADQAAVDAMRRSFGELPITGTVVIGEGQKDEAPELYVGEVLGAGGMECEIAVDPLEGTSLVARGDSGALAICAVGRPGGVMPAPDIYMQKAVRRADGARPGRHQRPHRRDARRGGALLRAPGARPAGHRARPAAARRADRPDPRGRRAHQPDPRRRHHRQHVGRGARHRRPPLRRHRRLTEGVITAAVMECLGGEIQAKMWPRTAEERELVARFSMDDADTVLTTKDLAPASLYVIATGVTDGNLLKGVRYFADGARTHSIVMDLVTNTVRFIDTVHLLSRTLIREIRL